MFSQTKTTKKLIGLILSMTMIISLFSFSKTTSAAELVYGDVNEDGKVDALDYSLLKQYVLGKTNSFPGNQGETTADLDLDGSINALDLSYLKQYILGILTKLPLGVVMPTETFVAPSFQSLQANSKLPDPFQFKTGNNKGSRITRREQWRSRREEISTLAQAYEFGVKPPKPQTVTGSFNGNSVTINCSNNGKSISFKCSIQYPPTDNAPYPAMIGVNMNTLNTAEILKLGVALITFPADEIGQETDTSSRGKGKFFDLYGSNYDAGALMAWAWGVDRLIDVLETTPAAKINPNRLGVTGGSRNGKGALAIGAFDQRIALTVPQESGNGGASGWRTADAQKSSGQNVQTLSQIITENCWFAKSFNQFSGQTNKLPYDHHEILALCAPRGLLVLENPDFEWLGNFSCFNTCTAAHMIYESLGIPNNMGYSSIGGHGHCQFPTSQQPELTAYIQKFLLDKDVNTNVFRSDKTYTFDKGKWTDWTVPTLQ